MHIPDNYLSPETCAVMTAAMVPVWTHAVKQVKKEVTRDKMPLLGVGSSFSFTGMMFNIPLPGGTTGHAVGGTLIALMLGPGAACIAVTITLLIQALLFGDGGILAFGANCFNMAFILPYAGYYVYKLLAGKTPSYGRNLAAVAVGSYAGINAAALAAAVEFGIQPMLFTDAAGVPLYCPYGLEIAVPAMMIGHITIFGLAEVVFTTAIYAFVLKTSPRDLYNAPIVREGSEGSRRPIYILIAALIAFVPLGLLATGTAWGEWEISEIPTMKESFSWSSLIPDYAVPGVPEVTGYILSAIIGVALSIAIFKIIAAKMKSETDYD